MMWLKQPRPHLRAAAAPSDTLENHRPPDVAQALVLAAPRLFGALEEVRTSFRAAPALPLVFRARRRASWQLRADS